MSKKILPKSITKKIKSSAYVYEDGCIYKGNVLLEGTYSHKGKGTLYYPDGKTIKQEGTFQIAGLLKGREYYPNGNLKFEGKFNNKEKEDSSYYGPSYPVEGRFYDKNGNLVYEGKTKIERLGSLNYPKVVFPECYENHDDDEIEESHTEIHIEQDKPIPEQEKQLDPDKPDEWFNV